MDDAVRLASSLHTLRPVSFRFVSRFRSGFYNLPRWQRTNALVHVEHAHAILQILRPSWFRRAVAKEWFHCAFTLLLAGVSLISSLTVVTMRFIAHLFNRNRVKHAT